MRGMEKRKALAALRARIEQSLRARGYLSWFFPPRDDGVRGWEGTAPVMLVALNPSAGRRRGRKAPQNPGKLDAALSLLYDQMARNGLADAHLTDVSKAKAKNSEADVTLAILAGVSKRWFLEEVRIIRPRLIIALERRATTMLKAWLPGDPRLREVSNYSWAWRFRSRKLKSGITPLERFKREMKEMGLEARDRRRVG
ncbi:MAG: hypothetical protein RDU83_00375 [bacterium]|nr:hypothetical protein [bacterium]